MNNFIWISILIIRYLQDLENMKNIGKDNKAQLYWDEEKMKESERGRGQYDKIEEPKTPYCLSPSNSQEKLQEYDISSEQRQIQDNLNKAKTNSALNSHCHLRASDLNQQFIQKMGKNHQEGLLSDFAPKIESSFMTKRTQHYRNEYKTVQQMGKRNSNE